MSVLQTPPSEAEVYDLCVVGAGPVGLSLALAAQARGLRVLVLEAGRQDPAQSAPDWSGSSLVRPQHHAPLALATHTGLAGTTWLWGGRCVPFEGAGHATAGLSPQGIEIAGAIAFLHSKGLVHADLSGNNVMLK